MRYSTIRQAHRFGILLLLLSIPMNFGCGSPTKTPSISEFLPKYTQPSKPIKKSQWLSADRIVIIPYILEPVGIAYEKPNPVSAALGNILFIGRPLGSYLTQPKDVSSEYQGKIVKRVPDIQKELQVKLEKAIRSRLGNKPVVSIGGPIQYQEDFVPKLSDTVLRVGCMPFISTNESGNHFLEVVLSWGLIANRNNQSESTDKIGAITGKNLQGHMAEQDRMRAQYDGEGYFFYKSQPHTREEWLGNYGQLIEQEMNTGIESVVSQLAQALLPAG